MDPKAPKQPAGLEPPRPLKWWEGNPLIRSWPDNYNPNGREAFLALVPDRYKRSETD